MHRSGMDGLEAMLRQKVNGEETEMRMELGRLKERLVEKDASLKRALKSIKHKESTVEELLRLQSAEVLAALMNATESLLCKLQVG